MTVTRVLSIEILAGVALLTVGVVLAYYGVAIPLALLGHIYATPESLPLTVVPALLAPWGGLLRYRLSAGVSIF